MKATFEKKNPIANIGKPTDILINIKW